MATSKTIIFFLFISVVLLAASVDSDFPSLRVIHNRKLKIMRWSMYWWDVLDGSQATCVTVVNPPRNSNRSLSGAGFGMVRVMDNRLTLGPSLKSKEVGRAQGIYTDVSSKLPVSFSMVMSFVFNSGRYNGSTLNLMGHNAALNKVRELSITGGTGFFRLAQGFAELSTVSLDRKTGNAVVQYNMTVLYYG